MRKFVDLYSFSKLSFFETNLTILPNISFENSLDVILFQNIFNLVWKSLNVRIANKWTTV